MKWNEKVAGKIRDKAKHTDDMSAEAKVVIPHYYGSWPKTRILISHCLRKFDEMMGNGLPSGRPPSPGHETVVLPAMFDDGGLSHLELSILGQAAKKLRPHTVFEIGTYNGMSTATFILNSLPQTRVFTVDLPLHAEGNGAGDDPRLIQARELGMVPSSLGLGGSYTQLLCDSLDLDPSPYLNSVDIGFIDGAHDLKHVKSDTEKMAAMMSPDGVLFWHDYGGRSMHRQLTKYINALGQRAPIYRVTDTWLAWCYGADIKKCFAF